MHMSAEHRSKCAPAMVSEKFSIGAKKTYHLHLSDKFSDIKERVTTKIEKLWEARAWNMKGVLRIA